MDSSPLLEKNVSVRLVPLQPEAPSADLLRRLAEALESHLPGRVTIDPEMPLHPRWRVGESAQLSSTAIVDSLIENFPTGTKDEDAGWTLGVTSSDLVGGGRSFVFGEAALGGAWAVVSTARLGAPGSSRFDERLLKEALHELGHLAGLGHCESKTCLMAPAADLAAVDRRSVSLCVRCRLAR